MIGNADVLHVCLTLTSGTCSMLRMSAEPVVSRCIPFHIRMVCTCCLTCRCTYVVSGSTLAMLAFLLALMHPLDQT